MRMLRNWKTELLWGVAIACFATTVGVSADDFRCDDQPLYNYESNINLCLAPGSNCYYCEYRMSGD